ncbi:MAG: hypothetical protein GTN70_05285 [Deltaproteobacteria bacterium]|nr:hypothetical protein [Deltaproteobacteria bacterium]NIS77091.1 hypothetical protein [Deltaproteobacteria bacterium]
MKNREDQKIREWRFYLVIILLVYIIWLLAFTSVNISASNLLSRDLTSRLDRQIPVIPGFVWLYDFCFILPFFSLFIMVDWHRVNRMLLSFIIANVSAFFVYVMFPTAFYKPELGQSIAERFLSIQYGAYPAGANNFPSMHVAFVWLFYLMCRGQRLKGIGDMLILSLTVAATFSTLFVKMHIVADALAGMVWAFLAWAVGTRLYPYLTDSGDAAPVALGKMLKKIAPYILSGGAFLLALISWKMFFL